MISSKYYFKRDTLYKEDYKNHRIFTELTRNHKVTGIKIKIEYLSEIFPIIEMLSFS